MGFRPLDRRNSGFVDKGAALLDRQICAGCRRVPPLFSWAATLRDRSTFQGTSEGALERKQDAITKWSKGICAIDGILGLRCQHAARQLE